MRRTSRVVGHLFEQRSPPSARRGRAPAGGGAGRVAGARGCEPAARAEAEPQADAARRGRGDAVEGAAGRDPVGGSDRALGREPQRQWTSARSNTSGRRVSMTMAMVCGRWSAPAPCSAGSTPRKGAARSGQRQQRFVVHEAGGGLDRDEALHEAVEGCPQGIDVGAGVCVAAPELPILLRRGKARRPGAVDERVRRYLRLRRSWRCRSQSTRCGHRPLP